MPRLMPRKGKQWGGGGEGLCFQTNTPKTETPVSPPAPLPSGPLGAESPRPNPHSSPSTGSAPPSAGKVGEDGTDF